MFCVKGDRIVDFLLRILNDEESEKVQALICMGLSKLMLSGMIADDRVCSVSTILHVCFS